jgi:WD40 repeat protein
MNKLQGITQEKPFKIASLDEVHLAAGYWSEGSRLGKHVRIFNWKTGGEYGKLIGHTRDVLALAKLDDGYLASGSFDTSLKIWQWKTGILVQNLTGHTNKICDLLSIFNFTKIVSCAADTTIKVWNRSSGHVINTLTGRHITEWAKTVILLENGLLASCSGDIGTIVIWNLAKGIQIHRFLGHSGGPVQSLINLINKSQIASCGRDWKIKIWTTENYKEVKTITGHSDWVNALVYLPNGKLASASHDKTMRIWDLGNSTEKPLIKTIFVHTDDVTCLVLLEDGNVASGSTDESIKIWHFDKNSSNFSAGWFFQQQNILIFVYLTHLF